MRIDKLLGYLRLAKTRSVAQAMVAARHIRLNGQRVSRPHQQIAIGDILTIPIGKTVRVIRVVALPKRRGPASEAQSCYQVLDETRTNPIAAAKDHDA